MSEPVLYHGRASTCSKKVRLSLYEKGVPFHSRLLDLQKFEQHAPGYLAINPKGVVPTLVHSGNSIVESSVIIEYVDEAFEGVPLAPADPVERAAMRLWLRFSDEVAYDAVYVPTWQRLGERSSEQLAGEDLDKILARVPTAERRKRWAQLARGGYSQAALDEAQAKMHDCLDKLEGRLAAAQWLVGDRFSLADIAVLPFVDRIRNLEPSFLDGPSRTAIRSWLERAEERPSFSRAMTFVEDPRALEMPNL